MKQEYRTDTDSAAADASGAPAGGEESAGAADPLALCLVAASKLLGHPVSVGAALAGLPLVDGRLTPPLFVRAAERLGFSASIRQVPLARIPKLALPVVLLLAERDACVLVDRDDANAVVLPSAGGGVARTVTLDQLAGSYTGAAIFLGRSLRFEAGTTAERIATTHHWFWGTLARSWPIYGEVAAATVLINIFTVLSPLFFMNVYDRVVPNRAYETFWVLAIGLLAVYLFDLVLKTLRGYFLDVAGKRADLVLSATLFEQVMNMRLDAGRPGVGTLANNVREFDALRDFFTSATLATLIDLPFVFLFIAVIWFIGGPEIAAVPLAAIPVVILAGVIIQIPLRDRIRRAFRAAEVKHSAIIETLGAIEVVKSLGAESHLQRRWEALTAYLANENLHTRVLSLFAINLSGWVQLTVGVGVLAVGVYQVGDNELTLGGLIACSIIASRSLMPLNQVAALLTRYHQSMSALAALNKIMEAPLDRPRGRTFVHRPRLRGDIEFRDVVFRYPGQEVDALRGVRLRIPAGDSVAIVGRVGSGKSTIARLLLGLYQPSAGSILIDGTDIRQIDPSDLRRSIGYVPQNLVLFAGTVRENLTMGAPYVDDADLLRAASDAGLDVHLNQHPLGFDRPVGERGEAISGGQRQAIAIARALVTDPPILVMDEPTHAMDQTAEARLVARLREQRHRKTLIVITHRESLLALVNTLVIVDGGRIVAHGPKDLVMRAVAEGKVRVAR